MRNAWRTAPDYDLDDLFQVSYMAFAQTCETYPNVIDPPHFMSLYKKVLHSRFTDLSRNKKKNRHVFSMSMHADDERATQFQACEDVAKIESAMQLLIDDAPPQIRRMLKNLDLRKPAETRRKNQCLRKLNEKLCHAAEVPETYDMVSAVRLWICGKPIFFTKT